MARSVSELLPRPFAEVTLDDVAQILATIGEERETLFFEQKATISGNALAKACSAFANTYGGLLVGGVADDSDDLVGMAPVAAEAQLWVKDTLRGLVLPMPPFSARWLPTEADRGLLLVLVEESTSTPHLLTRSGTIYVRNPGSSDPVPIADQRRLLDLAARGERADRDATENASRVVGFSLDEFVPVESLALAATGVAAGFEERLFAPDTPECLGVTTWGEFGNPRAEVRRPVWGPDHAGVSRIVRADFYPLRSDVGTGVAVMRNGSTVIYRGSVTRSGSDQPVDAGEWLVESQLRARFEDALRAARQILLEYGTHGDLRLAYKLVTGSREIHLDSIPNSGSHQVGNAVFERPTSFDDETVTSKVFAEIARLAGLGPQAVTD